MQSRLYTFIVGVEQSAQPDPGTPSASADVVPFSWLTSNYSKDRKITNTHASPYSAVAATSIAHGMGSDEQDCLMYLKGDSGAVDMSANPQIAAGTRDGQFLHLVFTSDTDTVLLENGNGLHMPQGPIRSKAGTHITFHWDNGSSLWRQSYWNGIGDLI